MQGSTLEKSTYLSNPLLKPANIQIKYSKEQVAEFMKCSEDPIYFIQKYFRIVNVDKGIIKLKPYEYQKEIIRAILENRHVIVKLPRQAGKCFCINTSIRIRNKKTGEILKLTIGDFIKIYGRYKEIENMQKLPS